MAEMGRGARMKRCYNCSGTFPHREGVVYPAQDKTCNACGKQGHFAKCCRSKQPQNRGRHKVHYVDTSGSSNTTRQTACTAESESSGEYVYTVIQLWTNLPHANIKVSDCNIPVMLDSGVTDNIIDEATYQRLRHKPTLTKCTVPIFPYGSSSRLPTLGKFTSLVESKLWFTNATFQVLKGNNGSLLGYDTASQLGLIKVAYSLHTTPAQSAQPTTSRQTGKNAVGDLLTEYADLFHAVAN